MERGTLNLIGIAIPVWLLGLVSNGLLLAGSCWIARHGFRQAGGIAGFLGTAVVFWTGCTRRPGSLERVRRHFGGADAWLGRVWLHGRRLRPVGFAAERDRANVDGRLREPGFLRNL